MKSLEVLRKSGLVTFKLNRPEIHNAFDPYLIKELQDALASIKDEDRAVLLCAEGESFCAGADLKWMKNMASYTREENLVDSGNLFDMIYSLRACPVPVIAKVQGAAIGGGAGLLSACDIALAGPNSKFGFTEARLGLLPAVISPFVLEKIGQSAASRYFITGELFGAQEALRIGLIHVACSTDDELATQTNRIIQKIFNNGPHAVRESKKLILDWTPSLTNQKERVTAKIADARISKEGQEGMNAFFEKRLASFSQKVT